MWNFLGTFGDLEWLWNSGLVRQRTNCYYGQLNLIFDERWKLSILTASVKSSSGDGDERHAYV